MNDSAGHNPARLRGQVAIITGGASGIGRATALTLASEGAHIMVADITDSVFPDLMAAIDGSGHGDTHAMAVHTNVADQADIERLVDRAMSEWGRIDILVAAAGVLRMPGSAPKTLWTMSPDEWDLVIATNLRGTFLADRAVVSTMMRQGSGSIINVSSVSGLVGRALDSAYCASKFGVIGLTEALREELQRHNIRVTAILPDAVATPFWEQNGPIPMPADALPPERVAELILHLVTLPDGVNIVDPVIAPVRARRRRRTPTVESSSIESPNGTATQFQDR